MLYCKKFFNKKRGGNVNGNRREMKIIQCDEHGLQRRLSQDKGTGFTFQHPDVLGTEHSDVWRPKLD